MLNVDALMTWQFAPIETRLSPRDAMLYALSLGYGADPMDEGELRFVFDENLQVVPSFASVISHPSGWLKDPRVGCTWNKVVHGEQNIEFVRPLPATGTIVGEGEILGVSDKGTEKGATILFGNTLVHKESGEVVARISRSSFCRADGGGGSAGVQVAERKAMPDRAPDHVVSLPTRPDQALLYRLNGDYNPLHASPAAAKRAGFDRPILHGLCTYGIACRAILAACCDNQVERLAFLGTRFTAPVFPGDTIDTRIWQDADAIAFECRVEARDKTVLGGGVARIRP